MDGSGNSMGVNMDKRRDEMENVDGSDNGKQHVNGEMENEAKNGENNEEGIKESDLGSNDANTDAEAISLQEFEKQMASINAPYGTEAEWNKRKKEWQDMLFSSYGFLSDNSDATLWCPPSTRISSFVKLISSLLEDSLESLPSEALAPVWEY